MTAGRSLLQRLDAYEKLMRLDKPVGILLLLWPTLWGVVLAYHGYPLGVGVWMLVIFTLGTVLMRSAGCVINDYADRNFDGHVARTRERPLVTGAVSPREALVLALVLVLLSFVLVLRLNTLTVLLSVPALLLAAIYPFTKRFLALPQAWLGLAFSFGIPMAFAAVQESVPLLAWALFACNVLWTIAYDTIYAMVDREDDRKIGIKTSALTFGRLDVAMVATLYLAFFAGMFAIARWQGFGPAFYVGWLVALMLAMFIVRHIRARDPRRCFQAFLDNQWLGLCLLLGMLADRFI